MGRERGGRVIFTFYELFCNDLLGPYLVSYLLQYMDRSSAKTTWKLDIRSPWENSIQLYQCSPGISFISIQFYHEIALCCNEHFCFIVTVSSKHLHHLLLFSVQREIRLFHKSTDAMMIQSNIQDLIKKEKKIRIPKRWHFLVEPKQFCPIWYSICVAAPLSIDSIFNRFSSSSGNDCCMPTKVFFTCTLKIDFLSRRKF